MARRDVASAIAGTTCVTAAALAAGVVWLLFREPAVLMKAAGTRDLGMLFGAVLDAVLNALHALIRYLQATP